MGPFWPLWHACQINILNQKNHNFSPFWPFWLIFGHNKAVGPAQAGFPCNFLASEGLVEVGLTESPVGPGAPIHHCHAAKPATNGHKGHPRAPLPPRAPPNALGSVGHEFGALSIFVSIFRFSIYLLGTGVMKSLYIMN